MEHRDDTDHRCEQLAEALPELLYGELAEGAASELRAEAEDCDSCADSLGDYDVLRRMFRALPDEEPPAAVTARLLHAAAEHARPKQRAVAAASASTAGERTGLWRWLSELFRPLVAHPAAAALASLVLVGGVAGILYLRGEGHVAQPSAVSPAGHDTTVDRNQGETPGAAGAAVEQPTTESAPPRAVDVTPADNVPGVADPEAEAASEAALDSLNREGDSTTRREPAGRANGWEAQGLEADENVGSPPIKSPRRPSAGGNTGGAERRANEQQSAVGKTKGDAPPPPAASEKYTPPPASRPAPTKSPSSTKPSAQPNRGPAPSTGTTAAPAPDVVSDDDGDDDTAADAPAPAPESSPSYGGGGRDAERSEQEPSPEQKRLNKAKSLHGRIAAEIARKRCSSAGSLAGDLRALDGQYYRDVFLRDGRLDACPNLVAATKSGKDTRRTKSDKASQPKDTNTSVE